MIDSLLLVIIFISILVSCGKSCRQRRQRLRENELEATAPTTQQGSNGAPGPENENERTEEQRNQMLHDRRLKILTTLVHKKVLAKTEEEELKLPHEKEFSNRSSHGDNDVESQTSPHKNNIFVETFTSWRLNRHASSDLVEQSATLYSPKSCSICLEPYREGDDICWSQNENCYHAYHQDCILDWLMQNDDCPLCRADYFESKSSIEC